MLTIKQQWSLVWACGVLLIILLHSTPILIARVSRSSSRLLDVFINSDMTWHEKQFHTNVSNFMTMSALEIDWIPITSRWRDLSSHCWKKLITPGRLSSFSLTCFFIKCSVCHRRLKIVESIQALWEFNLSQEDLDPLHHTIQLTHLKAWN